MEIGWTRRAFLAGSGAAAGALALGATAACSSDGDGDGDGAGGGAGGSGDGGAAPPERPETSEDGVPTEAAIFGWISQIFDQGVRRVGYPADEWAEEFVAEQFRAFGLEDVRFEPVTAKRWEPQDWSLEVTPDGGEVRTVECFPLPYSPAADGLELDLVAYDAARPEAVEGKASLYDEALIHATGELFLRSGSAPDDTTGRFHDPDGALAAETVLPFGAGFNEVLEPSMEAGAAAFVGVLKDHPADVCNHFLPYDAKDRPLPGVWVNDSDGAWLHEQLSSGPVRIRLTVDSAIEEVETRNVVGELPGADDEVVIVGSHHDGPWASAVEDGSGIALVLAQAAYWAAQPVEARPHRLVFLLHAAHLAGWQGQLAYIEEHRAELDQVVLQVHLEHAALEFEQNEAGELEPTGLPVPRWFFCSRNPELEAAVHAALVDNDLRRSLLVTPDAFGEQPPTDGAYYYPEGVPIMHFLAAPFYLVDEIDTLDKVDRENLVPLTRAVVQIIESTGGVSAAAMREGDLLAAERSPA
jgi:hypothetical protein